MASFPELHGEAVSGKAKMWSIRVLEGGDNGSACCETTHGYVDGKKQTNIKVISVGKNIGKKNETTPLQQAVSEAKAAWIKKKESGYSIMVGSGITNTNASIADITRNVANVSVTNGEDGEDGEDSDGGDEQGRDKGGEGGRSKGIDKDVPSPMLAHDFSKRGKSIKFPCFAQRKYDGTRCVAMSGKGLYSRNKKRYPHLDHIIAEVNKLPSTIILDGELYSDTLTFQEIVGIVKRETLRADGDQEKQLQIKLHVYDIINGAPYEERYANLQMLFNKYKFKHLVLVKSDMCESEEVIKELHARYVQEGYEGLILRNKAGLYKNSRSVDLQKVKAFETEEFKIAAFKEGEGLEAGCVIWVCEAENGLQFACRPRGTREEREVLYSDGKKYIGKMLSVRYQEMTDSNVPRFPVGIAIRDYE
jgi:ATP dependent DNA ligase domain/DNA ligase OB-like domain